MLGYVTIGTRDMAKAKAFYAELLGEIGYKEIMGMDRIAFFGTAADKPMLAVCIPYDEQDPEPGNGTMVAIDPGSKDMVNKLHAKALTMGASDEGEPGQRIPDMFYGAYIRDPDGNKLAFYRFE